MFTGVLIAIGIFLLSVVVSTGLFPMEALLPEEFLLQANPFPDPGSDPGSSENSDDNPGNSPEPNDNGFAETLAFARERMEGGCDQYLRDAVDDRLDRVASEDIPHYLGEILLPERTNSLETELYYY